MAVLIGDVRREDEYLHPVTDDPHFSENMLFTFFARDGSHGGLVRIGNRVNEGFAEVTFLLFLPDGRTLFQFKRASISGNDAFDAGGVRFDVLEPTERVRTRFAGQAIAMADPGELADPGRAFKTSPWVDVDFDVVQQGVGALYIPMDFHYEQHMHATGRVIVDGEELPIDAYGVRDHTWGRRNWHATASDRTIWCTFPNGRGFALSLTWHDANEPPEVMGSMVTATEMILVKNASIVSRYREDGIAHTGFDLAIDLENGERIAMEAEVTRLAPLRHRRGEAFTYIGQGMTHFRMGDVEAYGLSEYMDAIVDGKRVIAAG